MVAVDKGKPPISGGFLLLAAGDAIHAVDARKVPPAGAESPTPPAPEAIAQPAASSSFLSMALKNSSVVFVFAACSAASAMPRLAR